jgi:hypothetical protein
LQAGIDTSISILRDAEKTSEIVEAQQQIAECEVAMYLLKKGIRTWRKI